MVGHVAPRMFLIISMVVIFIIVSTINYIGTLPNQLIFRNTTGSWLDMYKTEVTPADFTFVGGWVVMFSYLTIFVLYACATLLRSSGPGFLYTHPNYLPPAMYIAFCIALVSSTVWVFTWDHEYLNASLFFSLLTTVSSYTALAVACHGVFTNQKALISYGHRNEYRLVFMLVINPLGLYAMWMTMHALVNLSVVLVYSIGMSQNAGASTSLSVLTASLVAYSLADLAFFERYFRYLYTPYIVLIWAFAGILVGNLDWATSNTVFTFGLILVTIVVFVVKVFLSLFRCFRKPLFHSAADLGNLKIGPALSAPGKGVGPPPGAAPVPGSGEAPQVQALPSWPSLS